MRSALLCLLILPFGCSPDTTGQDVRSGGGQPAGSGAEASDASPEPYPGDEDGGAGREVDAAADAFAAPIAPQGAQASQDSDAPPGTSQETGSKVEDFVATATDFDCLKNGEWTSVGVSRFKNVLGHTAEMLAVANSPDGGTYPVGTIVQLVPTEASVKRAAGFSPQSHDWEFFSLSASASGTTITTRGGGSSVVNFTGLSCLGCHSKAAPQWDLVCGDLQGGNTRGCAALPLSGTQLASLQNGDPRCP